MSKIHNKNAKLSDLYKFQYGTGNTIEDIGGDFPIYGSNGPVGFTNIYNSEDAPVIGHIGAYAGIVNWASGKHFVTYNGVICRIKDGNNSKFGYYSLLVSNLQKRLRGSTQPFISYDLLNDVKIFLPEKAKQQKIASVLSTLDAKIEINNKINSELEAMAKTLYDYWFVQFDFPDANDKPYKSSGGEMVWSEELKRDIPKGWKVGFIKDYCPSIGGFAFKSSWWSDKGDSVVKIKDIQENYTIDISNLAKADSLNKKVDNKFLAKPGNILIAMTGATIGKYGIVPLTDYPLYVNQRVGYFNLGNEPTYKLPYFINSLNQSYFRKMIFLLASGAAQPNISNEQINGITLLIPNEILLKEFNNKFSSSYRTILNNQRQNQKLAELRDWLLPMLMNGQVVVE